ncbi:diguanylate cyclase/phosphodiesterase with PAS/PAC and GAF sensor(s) [Microseira wollei NIES-4236]|uniref:Diguanylate cyclase/phosphodiesterase with PAS/PAC and GAF sensor(S) n=1 Tax=Microseira wollei NIES-4236 TaxID=2530354 RepID=A0AAV3X596_9CYAN|nr:diguanylate cyclase/phosphodiesterase with PAS/PAC and GAF sensor(s) [Microseira wollei NIES-4236]
MSVDSESLEIVRTIITLAHSLEMDAIAEGVESAFQLGQLVELEWEYGQGHFFSKPIDSTSVWALLSANC